MAVAEMITNNGANETMTGQAAFWTNEIDAAFAEARATDKYVLIAFGSEWTRSWRLAIALAFMDEEVLGLSRKFQCVMVNEKGNGGSRVASIYGVTSYPTVVVCNSHGRVLYRVAGGDFVEAIVPPLSTILHEVGRRNQVADNPRIDTVNASRPARLGFRSMVGAIASAILG